VNFLLGRKGKKRGGFKKAEHITKKRGGGGGGERLYGFWYQAENPREKKLKLKTKEGKGGAVCELRDKSHEKNPKNIEEEKGGGGGGGGSWLSGFYREKKREKRRRKQQMPPTSS
jgi:hypothetical protein